MKRNYDYVLIDSRTGLSDVADICTIELPDVLAVCFTLSDQSIEGAANVARQISNRYRDRNIRVLPVPMRIEDGEKEKLDVGRSTARRRFEGFPQGLSQADSLALLVVGGGPLQAVLRLRGGPGHVRRRAGVARLAARRVRAHHRRGDLGRGDRDAADPRGDAPPVQGSCSPAVRPAALTQVYLSYAPEDRMWADWIEAVLTRAGFRVTPRSTVSKMRAPTWRPRRSLAAPPGWSRCCRART